MLALQFSLVPFFGNIPQKTKKNLVHGQTKTKVPYFVINLKNIAISLTQKRVVDHNVD
jgi:hypothetical protein